MKQKKAEDVCKKHKLPKAIFCENLECKVILCPKCFLAEHRDHNVMDVCEKADVIKINLKEKKNVIAALKKPIVKRIQEIVEVGQEINATTSRALDEINYSQGMVLRQYEDAIREVRKQADSQAMKIIDNHKKQMRHVTQCFKDLTLKKEELEDCWFMLGQFMDGNNPNDIIRNSDSVINIFNKAASEVDNSNPNLKTYETVAFHRNEIKLELEMPSLGEISLRKHNVQCQGNNQCDNDKKNPHRKSAKIQCEKPIESRHVSQPRRKLRPFASLVKSWKGLKDLIASNEMGMIYNIGGEKLQAFNSAGHLRMDVHLKDKIQGITCLGNKLILTTERVIHLRDGSTGDLLDTLAVRGFEPSSGGICHTPMNTILVSNASDTPPSFVIEVSIKAGKLTQLEKILNIPLIRIKGLTTILHNRKMLVIATSPDSYSTVAVDYESGSKLWHIQQELYQGKLIRPWGICGDDFGHLFMSDRENNRVVEVSAPF